MSDQGGIGETGQEVYSFWNSVGAWVAAHPKTTVTAAVAAVLVVAWFSIL